LPVFSPPVPTKNRTRLIVGLVTGGLVLLCCLGGLAGVVGLGVYGYSTREVAAVTLYLEELKTRDFNGAYRMLCDPVRSGQTREAFVREQVSRPRLVSYQVGEPEADTDGGPIPVRLRYADRSIQDETFTVVEEADGLRVCP